MAKVCRPLMAAAQLRLQDWPPSPTNTGEITCSSAICAPTGEKDNTAAILFRRTKDSNYISAVGELSPPFLLLENKDL